MAFVRVSAGTIGALAFGIALVASVACGPSGEVSSGTGSGTVVSIDPPRGKVVLDHGQVPGVLGATRMSFQVANPRLLEGIELGDRIEFQFEHAAGQYLVMAIRAEPD